MPKNICNICLGYLDVSYRFWKQCKQANNTILNLLEEHETRKQGPLTNSTHSQYNLENCPYYRNSTICAKQNRDEEHIEKCSVYSDLVNEIIIDGVTKDTEDKCEDHIDHSKESFFEYFHLKLVNKSLNGIINEPENTKKMTWEEYFKKKSIVLGKSNIIDYKLEHDYCKELSKYSCVLCKKYFKTGSLLKIHFRTYHSNTRHQCTKCGQKCLSPVALMNHLLSEHPCYQCKVCKKHYLSVDKFEIHVKRNHNGYKPFQCKFCPQSFVMNTLLIKHEKLEHCSNTTRSTSKRLECQFCDRIFASRGGLEWHTEVKHGPKITHECDICLNRFSNSGTLIKHMKRHREFKPLICVICEKECPSMVHLQEHIKFKHQTQSTYVCELCDETCFKESDLITHIETHTREV